MEGKITAHAGRPEGLTVPEPDQKSDQLEAEIAELTRRIKELEAQNRELALSGRCSRLAIEVSGLGLWHWDVTKGEVEVDDGLAEAMGYDPSSLPREQSFYLDLIPPDELEIVGAGIPDLLDGRSTTYSAEHRFRTADGGWKWVTTRARVVDRTDDGRPLQVVGTLEDISGRKAAERLVRESEGHLRSLMESADNFVVYRLVVDEASPLGLTKVFASPSVTDLLGVSDEISFAEWFKNIHPDDAPRIMAANQRAMTTFRFDESFRVHHPIKGEWRWIHAISTGVPDEEGRGKYVNGILIDITDRVLALEALEAGERELEERAAELEKVNAALRVLLERRGDEKKGLEESVIDNVRMLIRPYIERLKAGSLSREQESYVRIIETNLDYLVSPFADRLLSEFARLTPSEVRVAGLIRDGKTSKEIADIMNLSVSAVSFHRGNIRSKLGLTSRKESLRSRLQRLTWG